MAFQLTPLRIPNMTTDYSAETNAAAQLGKMVAGLPDQWRKRELEQRQIALEDRRLAALGSLGQGGTPDFNRVGLGLLATGDVQSGAALLGLGQKAAEQAQRSKVLGSWGIDGAGAAVPSTPASPAGSGADFVTYRNQGAIRNQPLRPDLVTAMNFLPAMGVSMQVTSGGQEGIGEGSRRTGSTRHDHGGAGDVQFMQNGRPLSWENPQDVPVLQQIVRQARANGVTGIGAGAGYMNPTTTHIGFGREAIWGARGGQPYPSLAEALSGVRAGRPGVQVAAPVAPVEQGGALPPPGPAPVQVAQAPAQAGSPQSDAVAPGATDAQFFVPPGQGADTTIANDPKVQTWHRRYNQAAASGDEKLMRVAEKNLEMATKDAERRYNEGKAPEAVREWRWARENGLTSARSPVAYAKEKAEATRQDSAPTVRQLKQADGSEVAVQWNPETKTWDPLAAPKGGEAVRPTGTKLTEGQSKDLIYHSRGLQALEAFEPLAGAYADGAQRLASAVPGGNYVVTEEFQMAKQAGRNFLASVLRKDTGAAVTPSEEVLYGDIFLPQPGDKPGTLAQKSEARKQAIDAIRGGMGTAEVLALGKRLTTRQPGQDAPEKQAVPGAPPKRGELMDGYRFKGGDPSKPENWHKVK